MLEAVGALDLFNDAILQLEHPGHGNRDKPNSFACSRTELSHMAAVGVR